MRDWRAHKGVDLSAPRGTRVMAASDGEIILAGRQSGYGNVVEIRHAGTVSTLYAHLSGFAEGIRAGTRVRQGEVIGYVGSTGWATGPHLHYEFKVAGVHKDPLGAAVATGEPVNLRLRGDFRRAAEEFGSRLALVRTSSPASFE